MKQLTYTVDDFFTFDEMIDAILADPSYESASSGLMTIYEPRYDKARVSSFMEKVAARMPKVAVVGMTTLHMLGDDLIVPRRTVCSVLLFESGWVSVKGADLSLRPDAAHLAHEFATSLDADARGVLLLTSTDGSLVDEFVSAVSSEASDMPFFGAQAGTSVIGKSISFVFGDGRIFDDGIVAAAIGGSDLRVISDMDVGFRRLGHELEVTETDNKGYAVAIDGRPAADVYKRYLDVVPDENFFRNVCEFPLLRIPPGCKRPIARIPLGATEDGRLRFSVSACVGDRMYLSYGKPEYLLSASLKTANDVKRFAPQAIMLFVCMNRRVFMGNELADREIGYYRGICSDLCYAYGDGEIFKYNRTGSVLNSSLVCVGMREGDAPAEQSDCQDIDDPLLKSASTIVPLSERLVTFLEATSAELSETIERLEVMVRYDGLTGILNRRSIEHSIVDSLNDMRGGKLALIMFDVDSFKSVNDRFGHAEGDRVLKHLSDVVREVLRKDDVLGRWGGEEFLCVMNGMSLDQACALAERIRSHVEQADFGEVGTITISVGVTCAMQGESPDEVFRRVDSALYGSKERGKNRVTVIDAPTQTSR